MIGVLGVLAGLDGRQGSLSVVSNAEIECYCSRAFGHCQVLGSLRGICMLSGGILSPLGPLSPAQSPVKLLHESGCMAGCWDGMRR